MRLGTRQLVRGNDRFSMTTRAKDIRHTFKIEKVGSSLAFQIPNKITCYGSQKYQENVNEE